MTTHDATFYVQVKATRSRYRPSAVDEISAKQMTKNKPANLAKDTIAVKLTIRLPDIAFDALTPEAVVIVPAELVQRAQEIEAEAGDAS